MRESGRPAWAAAVAAPIWKLCPVNWERSLSVPERADRTAVTRSERVRGEPLANIVPGWSAHWVQYNWLTDKLTDKQTDNLVLVPLQHRVMNENVGMSKVKEQGWDEINQIGYEWIAVMKLLITVSPTLWVCTLEDDYSESENVHIHVGEWEMGIHS